MKLRKAHSADLEQVASWIPDAEACRLWAGPLVWFPFSLETLARDINFHHGHSYCLMAGASLAAFGQLVKKGSGRCHLARIIVAPHLRGCGYGPRLCRELIQLARHTPCRVISLHVYRDNPAALKLYRALGFREQPGQSTPETCRMELEL